MEYYQQSVSDLLDHFNINPNEGLDTNSADSLFQKYGPNTLPEGNKNGVWVILMRQFQNLMIPVLILAMVITGVMQEFVDAIVILITIAANIALGFFQEYRAQEAITALNNLTLPMAMAIRDGERVQISADRLVPGDVIWLSEGSMVSADARLIGLTDLQVDESVLTGESQGVSKQIECIQSAEIINDQNNMVFAGTIVTRGSGRGLVVETGARTQIGLIADDVKSAEWGLTPLQASLQRLTVWLVGVVTLISVIIFGLGVVKGEELLTMFLFVVSLAVSVLPEGLVIGVTVALAAGVTRMAKNKAVVRTLPAAEGLGAVSVIAVDKTGTLTQNLLQVREVFANGKAWLAEIPLAAESKIWHRFIQIISINNNAEISSEGKILGDHLEGALVRWLSEKGIDVNTYRDAVESRRELPFSTDYRLMAVQGQVDNEELLTIKGSPRQVVDRCAFVLVDDDELTLDHQARENIFRQVSKMASNGLKPIALAYSKNQIDDENLSVEAISDQLVFVGLVAFADAVRHGVADAVTSVQAAGVRVLMLTGDHRLTAASIAHEVGIKDADRVLKGTEIDGLDDAQLKERLAETNVFARVTPRHKLKIIQVLQSMGEVVAMTGDGVNDAPALVTADVGVAMGVGGTDVARAAADIILLDNDFSTIKLAIEEGRAIFDNIKKVTMYLLSTNASEVVLMVLGLISGLPLPLYPTQILWLNIVTDGLPDTALVFEPKDAEVLQRPPRDRGDFLLARPDIVWMSIMGVFMAGLAYLVFVFFLGIHGLQYARTATLVLLAFSQLFNVFNIHTTGRSLLKTAPFSNLVLIGAVIVSGLLQVAVVEIPILQQLFRTVALTGADWFILLGLSSLVWVVHEAWVQIRQILAPETRMVIENN